MKTVSPKRVPRQSANHPNSEAAAYIAEMCSELAKIAEQTGLAQLAYLLKLAVLESNIERRRNSH